MLKKNHRTPYIHLSGIIMNFVYAFIVILALNINMHSSSKQGLGWWAIGDSATILWYTLFQKLFLKTFM